MPDITSYTEYVIKLNEKEYRLVGLALIGELTKPEDIEAGRQLNIKLLEGRARDLQSKLDSVSGALRRAKEPSSE